jgi:peroxiredoxin/outer membrane lipoprotein-sorting protein
MKQSGRALVLCLTLSLYAGFAYGVTNKVQEDFLKNHWVLKVKLDISEFKIKAVQFAYLDFDPIPDLKMRLKAYIPSYYDLLGRAQTEKEKQDYRIWAMKTKWNESFVDIGGDKVYLITEKGFELSSNAPSSKQWILTKVADSKGEPIFWCIPVQPEIGKEITVVLNKENCFNLSKEFDDALAAVKPDTGTKYPSDPNFKDEPEAHQLYDKMINAFRNAKTLYYKSERWFGQEGRVPEEATYKIWLKKPNFARMEAAVNNKVTGTLVGDGDNFWIYWGPKKETFDGEDFNAYGNTTYMQIPSPTGHHSLAHEVGKLKAGISLLPFEPSIFHGCKTSLDSYLDGVRNVSMDTVNDEPCDVIEVSYMSNQRSRYYWVSRTDFLPRKIFEVVRADFTILTHEVWTNVFVDVDIPDGLFKWQPPTGWTQYIEPGWNENLLTIGTIAPDFTLKALDGSTIKLSDYHGKVVLLNFWRVGCPPCREEIPLLEEIYTKYQGKGLVVIGLNTADDYGIALKFINENSVTYPSILDTSTSAYDIHHKLFEKFSNRTAVPMNYLIGRDGKIVDAWYGYSPDVEKPLLKELEDLGVK